MDSKSPDDGRHGMVVVLGIFAGDTAYRADRMPRMGETILGRSFALGPGGKGSNQAVAAARIGGARKVTLLTRIGDDPFAQIARAVWADAGVTAEAEVDPTDHTGAAFIFLDATTGDNAIIVCPGAARGLTPAFADRHAALLRGASVVLTQLEMPVETAERALSLGRAGGAVTILNPAPAAEVPDSLLALCDYVTPNESEAEALSGVPVQTPQDAERAADTLRRRGAGAVIVTLGAQGALLCDRDGAYLVPAIRAGDVVETTGAGDAFNGGFAAALADGATPREAVRFGCAVAGISVTRPGAAASMPDRAEVEALLSRSAV